MDMKKYMDLLFVVCYLSFIIYHLLFTILQSSKQIHFLPKSVD